MHNGRGWSTEATLLKGVAPRSYDVITPEGVTYRRNRRHLLLVPQLKTDQVQENVNSPQEPTTPETTLGVENTPACKLAFVIYLQHCTMQSSAGQEDK